MKLSKLIPTQIFVLETLKNDDTRYVEKVVHQYRLMQGKDFLFIINCRTFENLIALGKVKEYKQNIYFLL